MLGKAKTPGWAYTEAEQEHKPLWRNGELVRGVLDKAAIGHSGRGVIHCVYELYGAQAASVLLDAIGRTLSAFLQFVGHSCGLADLVLTPSAEVCGNMYALVG